MTKKEQNQMRKLRECIADLRGELKIIYTWMTSGIEPMRNPLIVADFCNRSLERSAWAEEEGGEE